MKDISRLSRILLTNVFTLIFNFLDGDDEEEDDDEDENEGEDRCLDADSGTGSHVFLS